MLPEYRRLVAYIYQYQNGEKQKNSGYVKVEIRNEICRMHIQVKTGRIEKSQIKIYGFVRVEDVLFAIPIGEGESSGGSLQVPISFGTERLNDTDYGVESLNGLWLKDEYGGDYISVWDDEGVQVEKFTLELPDTKISEKTDKKISNEEMTVEENRDSVKQMLVGENRDSVEQMPAEKNWENGEHITEMEEEEGISAIQKKAAGSLQERWPQFCSHYPTIHPFSEEAGMQCLQIMPKDISFLGEREWQFGQNPFVRQGFLRYGHLLLGRWPDGRFILGVPGIYYDEQEHQLARMYGFGEFAEMQQAPEGTVKMGYWYHFVE